VRKTHQLVPCRYDDRAEVGKEILNSVFLAFTDKWAGRPSNMSRARRFGKFLKDQALTIQTSIQAAAESDTFASWLKQFNELKSDVTKAMDRVYNDAKPGASDPETGLPFTPNNHRILDGGHTISESMNRAFDVGEAQGLSDFDSFIEWGKAYLSDLSSPAGMPAFGKLTDDIYGFLRNHLNIRDETARDFVTVNGQEAFAALAGGAISAVALIFAWKKEDKEAFSRSLGSIGLGSVVFANPAAFLVAVVALAIGYNRIVCKKAMVRGGFISGVAFATSALIPGPILLGLIPAIVLTIYLNKKIGKDTDLVKEGATLLRLLKSPEFRDRLREATNSIVKSASAFGSRREVGES
jgi:hypothetical protein